MYWLLRISIMMMNLLGYGDEATLEIVPISFIEQSLCLVDRSPAKCNLCKELVLMWKVSLLPLWIWDELRRDFLVRVHHSYKTDIGMFSLSNFQSFLHSSFPLAASLATRFSSPCALAELEVLEFFSKKG